MALPLDGVKVLEVAQHLAGPGAARLLADYGADVIKVEPPGGEMGRHSRHSAALGVGKPFLALNRNKRDICLDLKTAEGLEICERLIHWADVLIMALRPHAAESLRLDSKSAMRLNPKLVYLALSGWGPQGPDADAKAYDLLIQARSGIAGERRSADGTPITCPVRVADDVGPMMLAFAASTALLERARTGKGRVVEVSLLGCTVAVQASSLVRAQRDPELPSAGAVGVALNGPIRCKNGGYMMLAVATNEEWEALCSCLGLDHIARDSAFDTQGKRVARSPELLEILGGVFAQRSAEEWAPLLRARDVPAERVISRTDLLADPQTVSNKYVVSWVDPKAGTIESVGFPIRFEGDDAKVRRPAPSLGEHNTEILKELGYSGEEIGRLARALR